MKAITILTRCRNAKFDIQRINQCIQQRREAAECITPHVDAIGGGHAATEPDRLAAFVVAIGELEAELDARLQRWRAEVIATCALLDVLPEYESAVLHQFYVQQTKVICIAKKMGFTDGYVRALKTSAERTLALLPEGLVNNALPTWYLDWSADSEDQSCR